jgi:hypothetical protein
MRAGLGTVFRRVTIAPGRRPSRVMSNAIGAASRDAAPRADRVLYCRVISEILRR